MRTHHEMYSVPCGGNSPPGCHGDGLRVWHNTAVYRWNGTEWGTPVNATSQAGTGGLPTGTGMDGAWTSRAQVGGTTFSAEGPRIVRWDNATGNGTLPPRPCDGEGQRLASDGASLFVMVQPRDDYACPGARSHLLRWTGTEWQASQAAAPANLTGLAMISLPWRVILPGSPTLAFRDDGAWWPLVAPPKPEIRHEANGTTFSTEPYSFPWGPAKPVWTCDACSAPLEGWSVELPPATSRVNLTLKDPLFWMDSESSLALR